MTIGLPPRPRSSPSGAPARPQAPPLAQAPGRSPSPPVQAPGRSPGPLARVYPPGAFATLRTLGPRTLAAFALPLSLGACALPLFLGACAPPGPARRGPSASAARPTTAAAPSRLCPATLDAASLLERHAQRFGSITALEAMLPRTVRTEFETEGKVGVQETVLDRTRYRSESSIGGVYGALGDDGKGPWALGAPGVLVRLREGEALDLAYSSWLDRRAYLNSFDPRRDEVSCQVEGEGPGEVTLRFRRPDLGEPSLSFDAESAALLQAEARGPEGRRLILRFEAWTEPDERGVRWPEAVTQISAVSEPVKFKRPRVSVGPACEGVDRRFSADGCLSPPSPDLKFEWPAGGVARVPMRYYLGELSLRVGLNGKQVWAILDSGAGLTAIDAGSPAGEAFRPGLEVTGSGVSQKVRMGIGRVDALSVGGLTLRHLPVASVPMPALEAFGDRRPEVIAGYSLFLGAAVRVDYAKGELAFARTAAEITRSGAKAVPFRLLGDLFAVDMTVEGSKGVFQLDTGNSGGLVIHKDWADVQGLLGGRPSLEFKGQTGAGTGEDVSSFLRLGRSELGPLRHDDRLAVVASPPDPGLIAGLLGNRVLSRCSAVIFDVERRTLWLEGSCDRPSPESNIGWRLAKNPDASHRDRPWVIKSVFAGSAAALAGLAPGDRLLDVEGTPAGPDPEKIENLVERPSGTKLRVSALRDGKTTVRATVELRPLLGN